MKKDADFVFQGTKLEKVFLSVISKACIIFILSEYIYRCM